MHNNQNKTIIMKNPFKSYFKIVEIPTGVKTKISDSLSGNVDVEFEVQSPFDKPIAYVVEYWKENNDSAECFYHTFDAENEFIAIEMSKKIDRCGTKHVATIIDHRIVLS